MKELDPLKLYKGKRNTTVSLYENTNILFNAGRYARAFFLSAGMAGDDQAQCGNDHLRLLRYVHQELHYSLL
jgi:hypothetical protein